MARGMEATPENLARACGISLEDAQALLAIKSLPPIFGLIAGVCRCLQVRMGWLSSGLEMPQTRITLRPEDVEALELIEGMSPAEARRWIKLGKRLSRI